MTLPDLRVLEKRLDAALAPVGESQEGVGGFSGPIHGGPIRLKVVAW